MIGLSSVWPKALFLVVALAFGAALYSGWRDVSRKRHPVTGKLVLSSAFVALWVLGFVQLYLREGLFHRTLQQIRAEEVASLEIGGSVLRDSNSSRR